MTKLQKFTFALLATAALFVAITGDAMAQCKTHHCVPPGGAGAVAWHPGGLRLHR
jgi:hypothetical protein